MSVENDTTQSLSPGISMSYSHSTDAADVTAVVTERDLMPTIELEKEGDEGEGEKEEGEGEEDEEDEEDGEIFIYISFLSLS